jgi:hypothetical protein
VVRRALALHFEQHGDLLKILAVLCGPGLHDLEALAIGVDLDSVPMISSPGKA